MKKIIVIGIILFLLLPALTLAGNESEDFLVLSNLLRDMGGELVEKDVVINGILLESFIKEEETNKIGEEILSKLEILGEESDPLIKSDESLGDVYYREVIFEDNYSQITYYGFDKNKNLISIYLSSYLYDEGQKGETYLCININKDDDFFEKDDIIENVEFIFNKYKGKMEVTSCLVGTIEGKYSTRNITKKAEKSIKKLRGKIIDKFSDESIISYTSYIPKIENYLTINEKRINLNLAIRYNTDEDVTYLWIGTPVITMGY